MELSEIEEINAYRMAIEAVKREISNLEQTGNIPTSISKRKGSNQSISSGIDGKGSTSSTSTNTATTAVPGNITKSGSKEFQNLDIASKSIHQQGSSSQTNLSSTSSSPNGMYYFYQSADGSLLFLHPLDIKILKYEFKNYDLFPNQIHVKITAVRESTLTEELRKRCKYLGHLPLACDITFCEIDLKGIVSEETLNIFESKYLLFFLFGISKSF